MCVQVFGGEHVLKEQARFMSFTYLQQVLKEQARFMYACMYVCMYVCLSICKYVSHIGTAPKVCILGQLAQSKC